MSVFSAEVARMHAAIDAVVADDATLRPANGGAFPCKAELFQPEPEFGLNEAKTVLPDVLLRITRASLPAGAPAPRRGDVIELARVDYRVLAKPTVEDDDGQRWTVPVEKLSA